MGFLSRLTDRATRPGFARSATLLTIGTAVGQSIVVLATPILSRLYTPSELGVLAVFSAVESILVSAASLRFEQAIVLPEDDDEAAAVLTLSLAAPLVLALVVVATVPVRAGIADALGVPGLAPWLWLLGVATAGDAWYRAWGYWALRKGRSAQVAQTRVAQGVVQAGGQAGLGLVTGGVGGLLVGWTLGRMAGTGSLFLRGERPRMASLAAMGEAARRFRKFALVGCPASLLNSAGLQMPAILFAALYGQAFAGLLLLANRVVSVPATFVGQAVMQAYIPEAATRLRSDPMSARRLATRAAATLLAIGALPSLLVVALGQTLFAAVFGEEWASAGRFAQVLMLAFLLQLVVSPFSWTLQAVGRQRQQLAWDAARLAATVAVIVGVREAGGTALAAVVGYAVVLLFSYAAMALMIHRAFLAAEETPP